MTCRYTFNVEWYSTMSRACYDCPCNLTDCGRERCVAMDGFRRPIAVVNRQLPGPTIEVCKGDRIIVEVNNELDDAEGVTIHWHGLLQRGTPYMDGANLITQCPIQASASFTYNFLADRAGTHWWHAHAGFQRSDGLFGPFIVREPEEDNPHSALYDYDLHEHTAMISDWMHETAIEVFVLEHHVDVNDDPRSILVNGKAQLGGFTDENNGTSHATPREVFEVEEGKRYRFRLISTATGGEAFRVSVDNHTLTIIASDGAYVQPVEVDTLVIYGGERYDVVLNASQTDGGNYWMKISESRGRPLNQGLAIIRYSGAPESNPTMSPSGVRDGVIYQAWNTPASADVITVNELVAIENATLPQENKRTFYMTTDFNQSSVFIVHFSSFVTPTFYSFVTIFFNYFVTLLLYSFISFSLYPFFTFLFYSYIPLLIYSFITFLFYSFITIFFYSFVTLLFNSFITIFFYSFVTLLFNSFVTILIYSFVIFLFCSFVTLLVYSFVTLLFYSFVTLLFYSFVIFFCSFVTLLVYLFVIFLFYSFATLLFYSFVTLLFFSFVTLIFYSLVTLLF
eukprot:XP_783673.3 PREDICTED: laccase-4-like [Strongylocentrotus purpuratus]